MEHSIIRILLVVCLISGLFVPAAAVYSHELYGSYGRINRNEDGESSYTWQISFLNGVSEHFAWSVSWLNEGHPPKHHRDGPAAQLWVRKNIFNRRLSLAVGAGPYLGFDTDTEASMGGSYENSHHLGGLLSLTSTWYTDSRWLLQARVDNVWMEGDFDTTSFSIGLGYQLEPPEVPGPSVGTSRKSETRLPFKNEISAFLGYSIINGPADNSYAAQIEYRRSIATYLDWTAGWLHEIDSDDLNRQGFITQIWPQKSFYDDRLSFGFGLGIYLFSEDKNTGRSSDHDPVGLAGLATLSIRYRLSQKYHIRTSWSRTITHHDRDTDVFLAGVGYHF